MDRRNFIKGIAAAASIGAVAGRAAAADTAAALTVASKPLVADGERSMILVCHDLTRATAIHRAMGSPTNVTPVGIGGALCGVRADLIVMDDPAPFTGRGREWWNSSIRTRLMPDGETAEYKQQKPLGFNYGEQSGIQGDWVTKNQVHKTATRMHRPPHTVMSKHTANVAASQILWFAHQYHGFKPVYHSKQRADMLNATRWTSMYPQSVVSNPAVVAAHKRQNEAIRRLVS